MTSVIFNECLVYLPHQGNIPQRMRLRLRPNLTSDDLLFQIDRQWTQFTTTPLNSLRCDETDFCASPLKSCTLTAQNFAVFVLNEHEHALLPIECVNDEVLLSCTTLLVKRKPQLSRAQMNDCDTTVINNVTGSMNIVNNVDLIEMNGQHTSQQQNVQQSLQTGDQTQLQNTSNTCKQNKVHSDVVHVTECVAPQLPLLTDNLTWETTKMMLSVIQRICTNYALEALSNSKLQIISQVEWQSLLRYAMVKANKQFDIQQVEKGVNDVADGVDYRVLRAFKRAIVGSMANAQRFRANNDNYNEKQH